jgi:hypothetical protein
MMEKVTLTMMGARKGRQGNQRETRRSEPLREKKQSEGDIISGTTGPRTGVGPASRASDDKGRAITERPLIGDKREGPAITNTIKGAPVSAGQDLALKTNVWASANAEEEKTAASAPQGRKKK